MNACSLRSMNVLPISLAMAAAAALVQPALGQVTPQPTVLTMERISVSGQNVVEIGRFSELPWISPDGHYVVFTTAANTLDQSDDEVPDSPPSFRGIDSGGIDVYLINRWLPGTDENRVRRLSRSEIGNATPNQGSSFGVISDAATIAIFQSKATNLDWNVMNEGSINDRKLYMVDLTTGVITMITQFTDDDPNDPDPMTNGSLTKRDQHGRFPAISGDGRFVYFNSKSQAIPMPGGGEFDSDAGGEDEDVFRYDIVNEEFGIVTPASTRRDSFPSVSYDGQWVAIESEREANILTGQPILLEGIEDPIPLSQLIDSDVFLIQGASADGSAQPPTFPVSLSLTANTMGAAASRFPAISGDGQYVAFVSWADDLVTGDALGNPDTFLRYMGDVPITNTGPTVRVSVGGTTPGVVDNTAESGCSWGCRPSVVHVPADATHPAVVVVAFVTLGDFDDNDTNGAWDVYVRIMREDDLSCGATYLVSAPPPAFEGGVRDAGDMASFNPHMRAEWVTGMTPPLDSPLIFPENTLDGLLLRIAFESYSTNLDASAPADNNKARDIYYTELLVQPPYCP